MSKIKNIGKSIVISGIVVPAMGVLAHIMPGKGAFYLDDASLSDSFECAYNINSNPAHREYMSYEYKRVDSYDYYQHEDGGLKKPIDPETGYIYDDGWIETDGTSCDKLCNMEKYAGTPGVIYPLHVLVAGLAYARLRRKEEQMAQKTIVRPNITR